MKKCCCGNEKLEIYNDTYNKCSVCGTLVVKNEFSDEVYSPSNEEEDLYGSNYWEQMMTNKAGVNSLDEVIDLYIPERVTYWLEQILKYTTLGGRIAEIGCGMGQLAYTLSHSGYIVTAFELSSYICKVIHERLGLNAICGELHASDDEYDTIIAMDVFEHLIDPDGFLEDCVHRLTSEGVLVMNTPCFDPKLSYEEMKSVKPRFELQLLDDQHIFLYSKDSIKQILKKHGFDNIIFVPAFFGDDYDMFMFASAKNIVVNDNEKIYSYINGIPEGRIIRGLLKASSDYRKQLSLNREIESNRDGLLEQAKELQKMVHEKEEIIIEKEEIIIEKEEIISVKSKKISELQTIRLGINIINLYPGKIGGAEQYVRNLLNSLQKKQELELFVFVNSQAVHTFKEDENTKIIEILPEEDSDTQLLYNIDSYLIDAVLCPLFFASPSRCPVPIIASILDIQHDYFPEYFEPDVLENVRKSTSMTVVDSTAIITISDYSRKTIIDKFLINPTRINTIYLNSDRCFEIELNGDKNDHIKEEIGSGYLFYPANTWPHKNHINLLEAYVILKEKYHVNPGLVFTGDEKKQTEEIRRFILAHNLMEDVRYLGYRPQEDMPYIYANASMLVFPSLFEGFGIPLVEAMRSGLPIVCSDCGSIPEIASDAAVYFDAKNPEDIASKIEEILNNSDKRKELVRRGYERCKEFSWEKCADETISFITKYVKRNNIIENEEDNKPLVSIITPSYNQGEFIRETIESVLSQDYPNIEYIVMDGGSTDDTVDILKSYGERIKWISEKDKGQGDAVNKGIRIAKGTIIGWLNSDDVYLPGAVSKIVGFFNKHDDTGMVYGRAHYIDREGNVTQDYPTMYFDRDVLAHNCFICQPAAFFRRFDAINAGLLDISYRCSMDYEFWIRLSKYSKVSYIHDYLASSRVYDETKTISLRNTVFEENFKIAKEHYGYVPESWMIGYADYLSGGKRDLNYTKNLLKIDARNNGWRHAGSYAKGLIHNNIEHVKSINDTKRKMLSYTGHYHDGWLAATYIVDLDINDSEKHLVISGKHVWPIKKRLVIKVYIDDNYITHLRINNLGEFKRVIDIPDTVIHNNKRIKIRLEMNKTFCPAKTSDSTDQRELSFLLKEIGVE